MQQELPVVTAFCCTESTLAAAKLAWQLYLSCSWLYHLYRCIHYLNNIMTHV